MRAGNTRPAASVNEYLRGMPPATRAALQRLRKIIRAAAPQADEVISYRIAVYKHCGHLVGFAGFKNHCSFFVMSKRVTRTHQVKLTGYETSKGTIRFTTDKPLPAGVVKQIVLARIKENEIRAQKKLKK